MSPAPFLQSMGHMMLQKWQPTLRGPIYSTWVKCIRPAKTSLFIKDHARTLMKMFCERIAANTCPNFEVCGLQKKKKMMKKYSEQRCGSIPYVIRVLYGRETLIELVMCLKRLITLEFGSSEPSCLVGMSVSVPSLHRESTDSDICFCGFWHIPIAI